MALLRDDGDSVNAAHATHALKGRTKGPIAGSPGIADHSKTAAAAPCLYRRPMKRLLVMRHAKSSWDTGAMDFDRPLNARGIEAAQVMADWLHDGGRCPDQVVASSAERARSTVQAVIETCGLTDADILLSRSLYHADVDRWIDELRAQTTDRLLICGHNPGLDDLVVELLAHVPKLTSSGKLMTTATIAHLHIEQGWQHIQPGCAALLDLKRPRS